MTEGESRTELVYGESNGGLTFLEKEYALDIGGFREALGEASTWGELKARVSEERYKETVDAWAANQLERPTGEGGAEDEPGVTPPDPDDAFDAEELLGYAEGDWPEFAPRMMDKWVDVEIIDEYGGHVRPTMNADYPVIDFDTKKRWSRYSKREATPALAMMILLGELCGETERCATPYG